MDKKHSIISIASVIIPLVIVIGFFVLIGTMGHATNEGELFGNMATLIILDIACLLISPIGLCLGIIGMAREERKREIAKMGIVFNSIIFIVALIVFVIGLLRMLLP